PYRRKSRGSVGSASVPIRQPAISCFCKQPLTQKRIQDDHHHKFLQTFRDPQSKRSSTMNQFSDQNHKAASGCDRVDERFSRRSALKAGIAAGAGIAALALGPGQSPAQRNPEKSALPGSTMVLDKKDTALVVIDPQNDVLSEKGVSW